MPAEFIDRLLVCVDCRDSFVFTAGEQIFFLDKQFKNDPKRCKPCKSKRAGRLAVASGNVVASKSASAGLARHETRTQCSECQIETTVPFRPTQGRPVLCRLCFQARAKAAPTALSTAAAVLATPPPDHAQDSAPQS
ncbi:MAG: hypothetical protein HIU93_15055 [Acidobacteria bacterium]|nr:hypothetical protein [Acidobacteriota bacterium]